MDFVVFLLHEPYIFCHKVVMKLLLVEVLPTYSVAALIIILRHSMSNCKQTKAEKKADI